MSGCVSNGGLREFSIWFVRWMLGRQQLVLVQDIYPLRFFPKWLQVLSRDVGLTNYDRDKRVLEANADILFSFIFARCFV